MIRKVTSSDIPRITALYNSYVVNGVETFETEPLTVEQMRGRVGDVASRYPYLVAEEDGRLAGFCYAHPWKERAAYCHTFETTVYLDPAFKRRGIGTALMRRLIAECRSIDCKALIACITGENMASQAFHASLGFTPVSLFRSVGYKHGRWLDVVDMELLFS